MTYSIEILNPTYETVETMAVTYTGTCTFITAKGREEVPESLGDFIRTLQDMAIQQLDDYPGHTALLFNPAGIPFAVFDDPED